MPITVQVAKGAMEASLLYWKSEGETLSPETLLQALSRAGVVHGIDQEACLQLLEDARVAPAGARLRRTVARGTPAVNGDDGRVELAPGADQVDEGGDAHDPRIDYRHQGAFIPVSKDQLLAVVIPPTEGRAGRDVQGAPLPATSGRRATPPRGINLKWNAERTEVRAAKSGELRLAADQLNVVELVRVSGNLDYQMGNIVCQGSVQIAGDVLPDFSIEAGGDVRIGGTVEAASVVARGAVIVQQGVVRHSLIHAEGPVTMGYVNNAYVESHGDIVIKRESREGTINAGGTLRLPAGGRAASGRLFGQRGVEVGVAGQPGTSQPHLAAGVDCFQAMRRARLEAGRRQLQSVLHRLSRLRSLAQSDLKPQLEKLLASQQRHEKKITDELLALTGQPGPPPSCRVVIRDRIHEGVTIQIGPAELVIFQERPGGVFFFDAQSQTVTEAKGQETDESQRRNVHRADHSKTK